MTNQRPAKEKENDKPEACKGFQEKEVFFHVP
jgi:hypothetical protein